MDPDATLQNLRDAIKLAEQFANPDSDSVWAIGEHFAALDTWLSRGGFLPTDWSR